MSEEETRGVLIGALLALLVGIFSQIVSHLLALVRDKRKEKIERQKTEGVSEIQSGIRDQLMKGVEEFAIRMELQKIGKAKETEERPTTTTLNIPAPVGCMIWVLALGIIALLFDTQSFYNLVRWITHSGIPIIYGIVAYLIIRWILRGMSALLTLISKTGN